MLEKMYVLFGALLLFSCISIRANPEIRKLTVKEEDTNINLFCYKSDDAREINSCKFDFYNETNKLLLTKNGTIFDIYNCSLIVASVDDFRGANKIECRIEMTNVTGHSTPIEYAVTYERSKYEYVMWWPVTAGVLGGAVLVGVMTYIILKIKALAAAKAAAKTSGNSPGQPPKSVEVPINNTDVTRYVTQTSMQTQGSQKVQKSDFGCPAAVVAPIPSRKKQKKKKEKLPPQHVPEENEEGEYEEIGILPIQSGMPSSSPPQINMASLPRKLPRPEELQSKNVSQTNSLQHKKKRPAKPPSKPRADNMQTNAVRSRANSNDQPPKHQNIKRQPPVKEKPKEIATKEKPNVKLPMEPSFLGELNRKLAKQPNVTGFIASTVRPATPRNDDDDESYEGVDLTKDFGDSSNMSQPLIEDTDRRPPHPYPKPKPAKQYKEKTFEKPFKTESMSNGGRPKAKNHEGTDETPKSFLPKLAITVPEKPVKHAPIKPVKPVPIKSTLPVKTVFTGKSPQELPTDTVKGKWNPTVLKKQGVPTRTEALPAEEEAVSEKSYESVSSDEECEPISSSRQTQQVRKLPKPPSQADSEGLYEPVHAQKHPLYHHQNRSDNYSDDLSSGEEWNDFDYIKVEPPTHKASGSIPGQISREAVYYDPNPTTGYDLQRGASSAQRSGSNLVQSGKPKDAIKKPLPPLPQESQIYENLEDIRFPVNFRGMKF